MDTTQFLDSAPGRLTQVPEGVWAFVPNPLPPVDLALPMATVKLLDEARGALGELAGLGRTLPNPHLLINPFQRREALLSSKIEGTVTTMEQLILAEASPSTEDSEAREVAAYRSALELGLSRLADIPQSLRLIRDMHRRLMQGVRGSGKRPGEFRRVQNFVSEGGQDIRDARYVPPPVEEMTSALHDLEAYLHRDSELPPLVRIALIHYQFEAIHPFEDGNGRVGRLLIALQTCDWGLLPAPLLYLSAYFEANRGRYMELLLNVSREGAWIDWVNFFLIGVAEQSADAARRARMMLDLRDRYRSMLQAARSSALLLQLSDELFATPIMTIPKAQRVLGVTYRSAQLNVEKLVAAGVLRELRGRRTRTFLARPIIDLMVAPV